MLSKLRYNRGQLISTVVTIVVLCALILSMIGYIYDYAEEEAHITLHLETEQLKNDINLQFVSDCENLTTMANLAAKLHSNGESYDLIFRSFKPIGLIEHIGILTPDNKFMTKAGGMDASAVFSFEEEKKKGNYVSGRVKDATVANLEVIRVATPIVADGRIVGILYGSVNLKELTAHYANKVSKHGANFILLEGGSGNYLADSSRERLGNIASMATVPFREGYTYRDMMDALKEGNDDFSAFISPQTKKMVYVHFAPVGISDWRVIMTKPEQVVFESAHHMGSFLTVMFCLVVLVMLLYLWVFIYITNRRGQVNAYASQIRKFLLELNRRVDGIEDALNRIRVFSKSRSAFFVDSYNEDHNDAAPDSLSDVLQGKDREFFIQKLMIMAAQMRNEKHTTVTSKRIDVNAAFKRHMPEFYGFLNAHGIQSLVFASVGDYGNNFNIIGVVNPKNRMVETLLRDVAVCFSMAVYNKKHLIRTETMALTDSLTGLANRMSYKQDSKSLLEESVGVLSCVYVDVNELHYFNNRYGHAAGDQMLVFISETLRKEFFDGKVYRMGGDEFLIFARGLSVETLEERMRVAKKKITEMKYHISYGVASMSDYEEIEDMVNEAEKKMYEDKVAYYRNKETANVPSAETGRIETVKTGIKEVDCLLAVLPNRFLGVYCVSLKEDRGVQVLAPTEYFQLDNTSTTFSEVMKTYIHDNVDPEYHRGVLQLMDYEILERQLRSGYIPHVSFKRSDGTTIGISVYCVSAEAESLETVWTFELSERT